MKKLLLTLLCVFGLAAVSHAETKTYQLCTNETEILNPDNQFIIVCGNIFSNQVFGLQKAPDSGKSLSGVSILTGQTESVPNTISVDVAAKELGLFSFKEYGTYKALYDNVSDKYVGAGTSGTDMAVSQTLSADNTQYQLTVSLDGNAVKMISKKATTRAFFFSNGTAFKNYATSNWTETTYGHPLFYKEIKVGAVKPEYNNYQENYKLQIGESMPVPVILPSELSYSFTTEDNEVVKIENNSTITALAEGTATIKFTTEAIEDKFEEGEGSFSVTVSKIKPQLSFRDQVVFGKLGLGVVWEPVIISIPEDHSLCGDITYTSSDTEIVEIDATSGQIHPEGVKAAGTVTITATMAANGDYAEGSASYQVVIIDPEDVNVAPALSSFDFTTYDEATDKGAYGMTPHSSTINSGDYETEITEILGPNGVVTITFDDAQDGSSKHRIWITNKNTYELRINSGGKFTVSVPDGYKISKIGFVGNAIKATTVPENGMPNSTDEWNEVDDVNGSDLKFDWLPNTTEPVKSVTFTNTATANISYIYVLYELASSNFKSANLSFKKVIHSIYENEEAVLNAVTNPNSLENITYSIPSLNEDEYTITPSADGKTIKVLITKPGYYSLEARTLAQGNYRDGFAIMRVNVYRHLDFTENGKAHTYPNPINTKEAVEVSIDVPELTTLYYKLDLLNAPTTQADEVSSEDEENEQEAGFEQYEDIIEIPAKAKGTLTFYIAAYGYKSPKRTILLGTASVEGFEHEIAAFGQRAELGYTIHINGHEEGEQYVVTLKVDGKEFTAVVKEADIEENVVPQNAPKRVAPAEGAVVTHVAKGTIKAPQINMTGAPQTHNVEVTLTHNGKLLEDHSYTGTVDTTGATGIENVAVDAAGEAEFFTLEGIRVAEPAAGQLYIRRQGGKATKVFVK